MICFNTDICPSSSCCLCVALPPPLLLLSLLLLLLPAFGLEPSAFMTTHTLLSLHVWLLIRRLSEEGSPPPNDAKAFNQMLYAEYFHKDMERRIYKQGVTVRWLAGSMVIQWLDVYALHCSAMHICCSAPLVCCSGSSFRTRHARVAPQ